MAEIVIKHKDEFAAAFVDRVISVDRELLLLVSGGSQIPALGEAFELLLQSDFEPQRLTVSMVDERFGEDPDHPDANFGQLISLDSTQKLINVGVTLLPVLSAGRDMQAAATAHDMLLRRNIEDPLVEVWVILGIGADGHTAGILPHDSKWDGLFGQDLVVGYDASEAASGAVDHPRRVTLTSQGILAVDTVWVYAGEEDQRYVDLLRSGTEANMNETPIAVLQARSDQVLVFN